MFLIFSCVCDASWVVHRRGAQLSIKRMSRWNDKVWHRPDFYMRTQKGWNVGCFYYVSAQPMRTKTSTTLCGGNKFCQLDTVVRHIIEALTVYCQTWRVQYYIWRLVSLCNRFQSLWSNHGSLNKGRVLLADDITIWLFKFSGLMSRLIVFFLTNMEQSRYAILF
jgi:hypothetical protein